MTSLRPSEAVQKLADEAREVKKHISGLQIELMRLKHESVKQDSERNEIRGQLDGYIEKAQEVAQQINILMQEKKELNRKISSLKSVNKWMVVLLVILSVLSSPVVYVLLDEFL